MEEIEENGADLASAEGRGSSLGEAKWAAVRELGQHYYGVGGEDVEYEVLSEPQGEDGVAVVRASLDLANWKAAPSDLPDEPTERVRAVLERILNGIGVRASVSIDEDDETVHVDVNGGDVGLLIGKKGRTIDAIQGLLIQIAFRDVDYRKQLVLDAAGYRVRRRGAVERQAEKAANEAVRFEREVELDPMGASDRKTVHLYLDERDDVETHSEGERAERRVVVVPV